MNPCKEESTFLITRKFLAKFLIKSSVDSFGETRSSSPNKERSSFSLFFVSEELVNAKFNIKNIAHNKTIKIESFIVIKMFNFSLIFGLGFYFISNSITKNFL
mgnify:CR=1 FL=1